jgi:hypothetical protein
MADDKAASMADSGASIVRPIVTRRGNAGSLGPIPFLVAALVVAIGGLVVWRLATDPLNGRGTVSQSQLRDARTQRPTDLHGFRHLRQAEQGEPDWRPN